MADIGMRATPGDSLVGLAARMQEPRLYVITYTTRLTRWLPIRIRHTYEKVCTWDEAVAQQSAIRALGITNCEVRYG